MSTEAPFLGSGHPEVPRFPSTNINLFLQGTDPEHLTSDTGPTFQTMTIWGYALYDSEGMPSPNAGDVNIGFSEEAMPIVLSPGASVTIQSDPGKRKAVNEIVVRGAIGDGVVAVYQP